jgi:hypothetical protein
MGAPETVSSMLPQPLLDCAEDAPLVTKPLLDMLVRELGAAFPSKVAVQGDNRDGENEREHRLWFDVHHVQARS